MINILSTSAISFLKILPFLMAAIVVSQVISYYVSRDRVKERFKASQQNIIKASMLGIVTPGPLIAFLPLLQSLKNKGMPVSILVAFITGQTLIGPARLFLEVKYFGSLFFIIRVIIALLIAVIIGTCFKLLRPILKLS